VTLTGKRLAFIGGGTMAEAMVRGLLDKHLVPPSHVLVTGPRRERRAELTKAYGVKTLASNAEAAADAHVVVLSVKPQVLATVMRELRGKLDEEKLVISIVAGATLRSLRDGLDHAAIVRAMPNTPAQVGMGITAWTPTTAVDTEQRERAKAILGALGEELMVDDENLVDMATALSGTGPTYVFLLMEALVDAGVHLGFSRRVAEELVLRTVEGSALFARKSGRHRDLPARKGCAADGSVEGRVRGVPANARARRRGRAAHRGTSVRHVVTGIVIALACVAGVWLASVDARTDDTGIEAGLIFLIAAALAAVRPRAAIFIAFIVGSPIPIAEAMRSAGFPAGIMALGFSVAGALAGALLGMMARRSTSPTT